MSNSNVSQVVVINAQKVADLEERLNAVLGDILADDVVSVDYFYEPETYGMIAVVRYLAETGDDPE